MEPDYDRMTPEELKLFYLYQKEEGWSNLPRCGKMILTTIEVDQPFYFMALSHMDTKQLCKHYRDMLILEEYSTMKYAHEELERRGYRIEIGDNNVRFIPDDQLLWSSSTFSYYGVVVSQHDHIIPVCRGGGGCILDGYQTLCLKHHKEKSRQDRKDCRTIKKSLLG